MLSLYKTEPEKDRGKISISYTNSIVKPDERKYLRTLPAHIKVEFQLNEDKLNLLLVHGSPGKINEYLFEDRDEKSLMKNYGWSRCRYYVLRTHSQTLSQTTTNRASRNHTHYRHAINIGSVGKPKRWKSTRLLCNTYC